MLSDFGDAFVFFFMAEIVGCVDLGISEALTYQSLTLQLFYLSLFQLAIFAWKAQDFFLPFLLFPWWKWTKFSFSRFELYNCKFEDFDLDFLPPKPRLFSFVDPFGIQIMDMDKITQLMGPNRYRTNLLRRLQLRTMGAEEDATIEKSGLKISL